VEFESEKGPLGMRPLSYHPIKHSKRALRRSVTKAKRPRGRAVGRLGELTVAGPSWRFLIASAILLLKLKADFSMEVDADTIP